MKQEALNKLKEIKLFLFDLEGVLLFNGSAEDEISFREFLDEITKAADTFTKYNVQFGIVTAHKEDEIITKLRAIENTIVLATSVEKVSAVEELAAKLNLSFDKIFYMGDEVLDIPLLKKCGMSSAPKIANREVKRVVSFIVNYSGTEEVFKQIFNLFQKAGMNESVGFEGNISPPVN